MPANNELLLTPTRIGIVHSPSLDYQIVKDYLSAQSWQSLDPEWCVVTPALGQPHPLMEFFHQRLMFTASFFHRERTVHHEAAYRDMFNYVTHLLIFLRPDDTDFKAFLKTSVPPLPKKVVTLTVN